MRTFLSAIALLFFTTLSLAQIGFNGGYYSQRLPEWEAAIFGTRSNENLLSTGYSAELDFRTTPFEYYRVEIYPSITYNSSKSSSISPINQLNRKFNLTQYEFNLKTNIYLLSMEADCDCPTFSREASLMKKGFFIQIAPGISYFKSDIKEETIITEGDGLSFKIGVGMGVDIGISDFIDITPLVKFNRYFNANWEGLQSSIVTADRVDLIGGSDVTAINQFYAGVRLGIRFKR